MYRGYQPDMFARTADPLPEGLTEKGFLPDGSAT
jgi:hypothetical protein